MAHARRRKGRTGLLLGLIVILGLGWVGYWYTARYAAGLVLDRIERGPVDGTRLGCADQRIAGFPVSIEVTCRTVTVTASGGRLNAELGGVLASAPLYRPGYVAATITSPLTLNAPGEGLALTVSWSLGQAEGSATPGGLKGFSSSFVTLEAQTAGSGIRLPVSAATASAAAASATPAGGGNYSLALSADQLVIVRANGAVLPTADLDIEAEAIDVGNSLGTKPAATLLNWLRGGATARIDRARIKAGGAIFDADGSLSITSAGVLSGNLKVRFANPAALIDLAETLRPGSRDDVTTALALLQAMTVPVETPDGPARETSLVIRDGLVAVGIIPIGVLPALRF